MLHSPESSLDPTPSTEFFYSKQSVFQNTFQLNFYDIRNPLYNSTSNISLIKKQNLSIFGPDNIDEIGFKFEPSSQNIREDTLKTLKKAKKPKVFEQDVDTSFHYFDNSQYEHQTSRSQEIRRREPEKQIMYNSNNLSEDHGRPNLIKQEKIYEHSPKLQQKVFPENNMQQEIKKPAPNSQNLDFPRESFPRSRSPSPIFSPMKKAKVEENSLVYGFSKENKTQKSPIKIRKFDVDSFNNKNNEIKTHISNDFQVRNQIKIQEVQNSDIFNEKEEGTMNALECLNESPLLKKIPKNLNTYTNSYVFLDVPQKQRNFEKKFEEKPQEKESPPFFNKIKESLNDDDDCEFSDFDEPLKSVELKNNQNFSKKKGDNSISFIPKIREQEKISPMLEKESFLQTFGENDKKPGNSKKKGLSVLQELENTGTSRKNKDFFEPANQTTVFSELEKMKFSKEKVFFLFLKKLMIFFVKKSNKNKNINPNKSQSSRLGLIFAGIVVILVVVFLIYFLYFKKKFLFLFNAFSI